MGGMKERGKGAMNGTVTLYCSEKTRASEVRMKLKSVIAIAVPKASQATNGDMSHFAGLSPSTVSNSTREHVLLQLDKRFRPEGAQYRPTEQSPLQDNHSGRLDRPGYYEWTFQFDLPEQGTSKNTLPNGFPGVGTFYPPSYVLESDPIHGRREEWASVKWYLKVTVERPGLFRSNDRTLIPFIYMPPPPDSVSSLLIQRQALSAQTQDMVSRATVPFAIPSTLAESPSKWKTHYIQLNEAALGHQLKRTFFQKLTGSNKPKEERWALSLPGNPLAVFPLRAVVPFVLTLVHSAEMPLVVHPHVALVQKVHLRARSTAAHAQYIAHATVVTSSLSKSGMQQWFGWIQFPSWCTPTFDTSILGVEYFLQVKPLKAPEAQVLLNIPVGLYCSPPRLLQTLHSASATAQAKRAASMKLSSQSAPIRRVSNASTGTMHTTLSSADGRSPVTEDPARMGLAGIGLSRIASPAPSGEESPRILGGSAVESPSMETVSQERLNRRVPPLPIPEDTPASNSNDPLPSQERNEADEDLLIEALVDEYSNDQTTTSPLSSPPPNDNLVHDAGPLTREQEEAWTRDILAHAFNEDDMAQGFDLPPSYFEATGIQDMEG
ncbi:hypothetical protein MEQU1_002604 [Malassezia equina]|uniref:Arrestin-like N-terminal domain-containing protein n=1 Tax=Malassezia equina TaxID=1381935 RepID=A0AAF0EE09_9BASI|nr:hypothetical protein MEQU1_002604 [Malassezia equina]